MKYELALLHVIEDGNKEELLIQFSYDNEKGCPFIYAMKGSLTFLNDKSLPDILKAAIMQNEYCGMLDGETFRDEIYFDLKDFDQMMELENNYFNNSLNYDPKKTLSKIR